MKVVIDTSGDYPDVVSSHYDLMKYNDDSSDIVLFQGYNSSRNNKLKSLYAKYPKRIYLNLESPTGMIATKTNFIEQSYFTHVYNICPYTAELFNKQGHTKHIPIAFPVPLDKFNHFDKEYDVMYMGRLMPDLSYRAMIDVISSYKYVFVSPEHHEKATNTGISTQQKWDLLSKSKICVGINQASVRYDQFVNIKSYQGWETHPAFNMLDHSIMIPQFKSRVTEAMAAKSLLLMKHDRWNVIEEWFEPGKHFMYWHDINDLNELISDVVNNYDNYLEIINNAYEEVKKYDINSLMLNKFGNEN